MDLLHKIECVLPGSGKIAPGWSQLTYKAALEYNEVSSIELQQKKTSSICIFFQVLVLSSGPQKKCNFQSYDKITAGDSNWCQADHEVKTIPFLS